MARIALRGLAGAFLCATVSILSAAVGPSVARADVNPDGSFNYTIPLEVPAGPHGAAPRLALVYNSNWPNGMLGVGWGLTGLPVITRMNYGRGINYNGQDTYGAWEGRLVKLSDGTYHSDPESLGRYVPNGTCGDGPCSWVLTDKDGGAWTFGSTTDARIPALGQNGSVRIWALNQYADRFGNGYTVSYDASKVPATGDYYPVSIAYSSNFGHALTGISIRFSVQGRNDVVSGFAQSAPVTQTQLLSGITAVQSTQVLRQVQLTYGNTAVTGASVLTKVQVLDPQNIAPPLEMDVSWLPEANSFSMGAFAVGGSGYGSPPSANWTVLTGDFNGDGMTDVAFVGDTSVNLLLSSGGGNFATSTFNMAGWSFGTPPSANWTVLTGDFNGDGLTDIAFAGDTSVNLLLSTGGGNFAMSTFDMAGWSFGTPPMANWTVLTGDFNGDGMTDIAFVGDTSVNLLLGAGGGNFAMSTFNMAGWSFGTPSWTNWTIVTGDFNGDGMTDIAFVGSTAVNLLLGAGAGSFAMSTFNMAGWSYGTPPSANWTVVTGDFNGDGLTDIAFVGDTSVNLLLGAGGANFAMSTFNMAGWSYGTPPSANWTIVTGDFNGDGLTDIGFAGSTVFNMLVSTGGGSFAQSSFGMGGWSYGTPPWTNWTIFAGDFNGDGITDVGFAGSTAFNTLLSSGGFAAVASLKEPSGSIVTPAYASAPAVPAAIQPLASTCGNGSGSGYAQPCGIANSSPRRLVTQVTVDDGLGLPSSLTSTSYGYSNGRLYPGTIGESAGNPQRKDLGFQTVTATASPTGLRTVTTNRQVPPFQGQPLSVVRTDANGTVLVRDTTIYLDATAAAGSYAFYGLVPANSSLAGGKDLHLILVASKTSQSYEGGVLAHTTSGSYGYDSLGNLVSIVQAVDGDSTTTNVSRSNFTAGGSWLLGRVDSSMAIHTASGNVQDYLQLAYNGLNQVIRRTRLLCPSAEACSIGGAGTSLVPVEQNRTYDSFGNPASVQDALGHTTRYQWDANGVFLLVDEWDVASAAGGQLQRTRSYDAFGHVLTDTDANNQTTAYGYDGLGRLATVQLPNNALFTSSYVNWGNPDLQYVQVTHPDGSWVRNYLDGLGWNYLTTRAGDNGQTVFETTARTYGLNQKMVTSARPYYVDDTVYTEQKIYDLRGRLTSFTDATGATTTYGYSAGPMSGTHQVAVTDPNGHVAVGVYDGYGHLTSKTQGYRTANQTVTQYRYGAAQRLTSVILPNGQEVSTAYDSFGRKTAVTDPSTGQVSFAYDADGNTLTQSDALDRSTEFTYDALNRPLTKTTFEGTVSFIYDDPAVANGQGRLTQVTEPFGSTALAYDALGNVAQKTLAFDGLSRTFTESRSYDALNRLSAITYPDSSVAVYSYTPAGNLHQVQLNGSVYATYSNYTADGRIGAKVAGSGSSGYEVTSEYQYDPRGDLTTLVTTGPAGQLQNLLYAFDPAGNVASITDRRANTLAPYVGDGATEDNDAAPARQGSTGLNEEGGGGDGHGQGDGDGHGRGHGWDRGDNPLPPQNCNSGGDDGDGPDGFPIDTRETQSFGYDALDRLAAATGYYGHKTFRYDAIGNLLHFAGVCDKTLAYSGQQATSSSDSDFSARYDAAGNLTEKTFSGVTWNYSYDTDNRLTQVSGRGTVDLSFDYDYRGERVRKTSRYGTGSTTTYYIGPDFELRQNAAEHSFKRTLHLSAPGLGKIASITVERDGAAGTADAKAEYAYAGRFDGGNWRGLAHKALYLTLGAGQDPDFGRRAVMAFLGAATLLLVGAAGFNWMRDRRRPSRFCLKFRLAALGVAVAMLAMGCKSESGGGGVSGGVPSIASPPGGVGGPLSPLNAPGQPLFYGHFDELLKRDVLTGPIPGTWFYQLNEIGSTAVITDGRGVEATRFLYMPYGEIDPDHSTGAYTVTSDFTGQERDPEDGLMYFHARYYDPSLGRFLTPDSIIPDVADGQSFNRYTYVRGNPVTYTDPTGHDLCIGGCGGGCIIGCGGGGGCIIDCGGGGSCVIACGGGSGSCIIACNGNLFGGGSSGGIGAIGAIFGPGAALTAALVGAISNPTTSPLAQALSGLGQEFAKLGSLNIGLFQGGVNFGLFAGGLNLAQFKGNPDFNQLLPSYDTLDLAADAYATGAQIAVTIGVTTILGPIAGAEAGAATGGFYRGFLHSLIHGKGLVRSFEAGGREAIIESVDTAEIAGLTFAGLKYTELIKGKPFADKISDILGVSVDGIPVLTVVSAISDQSDYSHSQRASCDRSSSKSCGLGTAGNNPW